MGLGIEMYVRMYRRTDSHVTTKIFEINGLQNFLRYGALLMCLRRAGALLTLLPIILVVRSIWSFSGIFNTDQYFSFLSVSQ